MRFQLEMMVGLDIIDRQHEELLSRFDQLMTGLVSGRALLEVIELMSYLEEYVVFHFALEQSLMEQNRYPHKARHQEQHEYFKGELEKLKNSFMSSGATWSLAVAMADQLASWFVEHIASEDKALSYYISESQDAKITLLCGQN